MSYLSCPEPDNAGPDTRPNPAHLTCVACRETGASVSTYNRESLALCYDCAEAAEAAREAAD
jgi:hypothetical protein